MQEILAQHKRWVESEGKEGARASLSRADLRKADLIEANLQGADLFRANLQEAGLIEANLQGADLSGANLQGARLFLANLQGANLREARGLTQEQLDGACGDSNTKLPPGMSIGLCLGEGVGACRRVSLQKAGRR